MNKFSKKVENKKSKDSMVRNGLLGLLSGTFLGKDKVLDHMPFMLFLVGVAILYISYGYHAESTVKKMYLLESQVKDLKSQDLTLKSDLEQVKQQSNVAQAIKEMGLKESVEQPFKIKSQGIE
jgi:outer membrane murein-binding lipoprotein Lpp